MVALQRSGLLAVVWLGWLPWVPARAAGQVPTLPPPAQAASALQQAVQQNPGLPDVIRQRIGQSGLTPDQIRARLQASGYPPTLLDAYMGQPAPGTAAPVPGAQELAARPDSTWRDHDRAARDAEENRRGTFSRKR